MLLTPRSMWPQAQAALGGWTAGAPPNPFSSPLPNSLSQQRTWDSVKSLSPEERNRGYERSDYDSDDELAAYQARRDAES